MARLASSPSGHTTDELSQPTLGEMVARECRYRFVDDGFDDQETMLLRIPLSRFKLATEAVSPCLRLGTPPNINRGGHRWLDRLGDHAGTMTIDPGSSKS